MANKVKVAAIIPITQGLCPSEIRVREISIVDDIRLTAHGAKLQKIPLSKDLCIDACFCRTSYMAMDVRICAICL